MPVLFKSALLFQSVSVYQPPARDTLSAAVRGRGGGAAGEDRRGGDEERRGALMGSGSSLTI